MIVLGHRGRLVLGGGGTASAEAVAEVLGDALAGEGVAEGVRGVLSEREALPDTGWTDVVTGTGAVSHASGVHTLSIAVGDGAETLYPAPSTPECPALELIARLDVSTGVPGSTWWGAIELRSPTGADALIAQVTEAGVVQAWRSGTGTPLASTGSGVFSLTSGEAWLRLVVTPYYAAVFYGTGSGSTPPTSWTKVHQVETDAAQHARGAMTRVGLRVGRIGGSGTFTIEFRNVQARVLGIAPL